MSEKEEKQTPIVKTGYYGLDDLDGGDTRSDSWKEERRTRGFDETEMWSLGGVIIRFSLPRIKRMYEIETEMHALTKKDHKRYKQLIEGLELFVRDDESWIFSSEERKKVNKALKLFGPMIQSMWY